MTREQWRQVRRILDGALELPPHARTSYLDEACGGDAFMRAEVESLLTADEQASGFLTGKAVDYVTDVDADLSGSADSLQGRRIGPYLVLEEIGHGGMGTVYRAVRADDQYRKEVAIKVVRDGFGDELAIHRFRAERQILANLDHANIARLLEGGATEDGRPYVVMESIRGKPIDHYAAAHQLSIRDRIKLFRTVCSAVSFAHSRLVIHRDIKPGNILVTEEGEPKLLDFGIAKILDEPRTPDAEATVTMVRLMTPEYASPEQVRGEPVSTATDVYSLGIVLYQLLTGRRAYSVSKRTPHEMAQAVLEIDPVKPSAVADPGVARALQGDLDNIILKALHKEPERRYASVEQLSEDLRRHLDGLPVIARPDTLVYRSSKFIRRYRWAVSAAAIAVLALVGGMAGTLREAQIASAQRQRAIQRFNDVRQLANSLVFDVYDSIENLPGATPARKILIQRALQYLDKLATEARGDISFQRELAAAYERAGDVQGGFRASNLGDIPGFISSYRKALSIREAVLRAEPHDAQAQRELLHTHARLSDAFLAAGDLKSSVDQTKQVLSIAGKLSAADPENQDNRRNLAIAYLDYGWKRSGLGDFKGSLQDCRKGLAMLESFSAANPNDKQAQRFLALAYGRIAQLLSGYEAKHAESLVLEQKALAVEQAMLSADPHNTDLRRLHAWDTMRTGEEIFALGDSAAAIQKYRAALDEMQMLSTADPKSVQFHTDVAQVLARLGAAHLLTGNAAAAQAELQHSIAEIGNSGTLDIDALATKAEDEFRLGKANEMSHNLRQAALWYQRSIPLLQQANGKSGLPDIAEMITDAKQRLSQLNRR